MKDNERAIFEGLNPEQRNAVEFIDGPALIVAGAGSGKTRVLTCKVANILAHGVPSERVLSLTFTKKAAQEMKDRIGMMVGARAARRLVMGTFHSVFIRFLRDYAEFLGYPKDFTIYDQSDTLSLIKTCLKEMNLDDKVYKPKTVMARISDAKNNLVSPARYYATTAATDRDRESKMPRLVEVYDMYWKKCREAGVMDFDDILFEMNILLRDNPAALEEISSRFDYILVDEYQDTNQAQYIILRKLAMKHHRICVVGDDSQSIYAFRGARIQNILNFKKDYPECRVFRLEQNYRSTQTIVDAANSLIAHNSSRIPKTCFSAGEKGEPIHLIKAYSDIEEASLVVSSIADIIRREGAQYQDFAILYRTNAQSRAFEDALRRRNIPYMIYSGNSFFERAEVKDLMAYLKLVVNPLDNESFKRIVNKPARGIGDTSLAYLMAAASDMRLSLMECVYSEGLSQYGLKLAALQKIRQFTDMILGFHNRLGEDAYNLAYSVALDSGLLMFFKSDLSVEGQARFANVDELLNSVKSFIEQKQNETFEEVLVDTNDENQAHEASEARVVTLPEYLEDIALLSAVDVDDDQSSNKVALMTVHTSKGLEFPYVHIVGMEETLFPGGVTGAVVSPGEIEEERRLFYVALTRAKKMVRLSFASERMRHGKSEHNDPSRFIREIDSKYIDNPLLEGNKAEKANAFWGEVTGFRRGPLPGRTTSAVSPIPKPANKPLDRPSDPNFVASPISELAAGQRIEHNRFGFGEIKEIEDGESPKARIIFDKYGEKVLLLKYAKMRII